jgi:putative monooxygenase
MQACVLRFDELDVLDPGTGVVSRLLVHDGIGSEHLTSGITTFAPGAAIASHWHNCDESVVVVAGEATAEIDGALFPMKPYDATFVPAGVPHRVLNRSDAPMTICWLYAAGRVTRTFAATGLTVDHLQVTSAQADRGERRRTAVRRRDGDRPASPERGRGAPGRVGVFYGFAPASSAVHHEHRPSRRNAMAVVAHPPVATPAPALPPGHASARASGSIVYPLMGLGLILLQILAMIALWVVNRG